MYPSFFQYIKQMTKHRHNELDTGAQMQGQLIFRV